MDSTCQIQTVPASPQRERVESFDAPTPPLVAQTKRFAFIDGLRGFAALAILTFHIWYYEQHPCPAIPDSLWFIDTAMWQARSAVQVLLVISGFVIAYTLRNVWVTPDEAFTFIGRRLIRLVPAYWVTIAVVILVDALCRNLWNLRSPIDGDLSVSRVTAHMAFVQDIFRHDSLSAGMWTLCIEIQFYLVAVLGWGLAQRLIPKPAYCDPSPSAVSLMIVFAPLAFISLFHWRASDDTIPWVTHFLWMFFLGMVTWWTSEGLIPRKVYTAIVAVAVVELIFDKDWRFLNAVALTTAVLIDCAGRTNNLHVWLNWPWLQYIGRISYSLYLIHFSVCHLVTTAGWKWCEDQPTSGEAKAILLTAFVASLFAGHTLYVLVEAPSARWAARTKLRPEQRNALISAV